jgi:uncharacterized damage-inducible protein DinB
MNRFKTLYLLGLCVALSAPPVAGQSAPVDFRDEVLVHFERSTRKLIALADAIPEDLYLWSPGEGVMSIAQVYMHIARYNYYYPETALGISAPERMDVPNLETISDKAEVTRVLRRSVDHVRKLAKRMTENDLTETTILYGREIPGWSVLLQLIAHMNEHVGQSVAYARMNGVVPPWSR